MYIGWGNKYFAYNYSPPPMPQVLDEYKIGPEVMEITDPSFEEEEAYRIAHLPPPPKEILGEKSIFLGKEFSTIFLNIFFFISKKSVFIIYNI